MLGFFYFETTPVPSARAVNFVGTQALAGLAKFFCQAKRTAKERRQREEVHVGHPAVFDLSGMERQWPWVSATVPGPNGTTSSIGAHTFFFCI